MISKWRCCSFSHWSVHRLDAILLQAYLYIYPIEEWSTRTGWWFYLFQSLNSASSQCVLPNSKGMFHVSLEGVQKRLLNLELPTTPCVSFVMITSKISVISRPFGWHRSFIWGRKNSPQCRSKLWKLLCWALVCLFISSLIVRGLYTSVRQCPTGYKVVVRLQLRPDDDEELEEDVDFASTHGPPSPSLTHSTWFLHHLNCMCQQSWVTNLKKTTVSSDEHSLWVEVYRHSSSKHKNLT